MFTTSVSVQDITKAHADVLILFVPEGSKLPSALAPLDKRLSGQLKTLFVSGDITGKSATAQWVFTYGQIPTPRLLIMGLGKGKLKLKDFERAVGTAAAMAQQKKCTKLAVAVPTEAMALGVERMAVSLIKNISISSYRFDQYRTQEKEKLPAIASVAVHGLRAAQGRQFAKAIPEGIAIAAAVHLVRDAGNTPSNDATPKHLAEIAKQIAKSSSGRLKSTVFNREQMQKLGMNAVLAVAQGSVHEPTFMVLEYTGNPSRRKDWYAFVGKAITFDSGGISLKPGERMDEMKFDMAGGAAVLAAMQVVAVMKLRVNIVALVPSAENMPSGSSYKPGDVITSYGGKTIEILNTDAEGRVILADALGYAAKWKPKKIVDLATLTGAVIVALGNAYSGIMGNDERFIDEIRKVGEATGERVWPLPLGPEYSELNKSHVADVQNSGARYLAGVSAGGAFLAEFVPEGSAWAHLDIAATAWNDGPKPWIVKGATGMGVHLLVELAKRWAGKR